MPDDKERYENYRHRAETLRSVAESMTGLGTRDILLRLAVDYDRMADRLQRKPP